MKGLVFFVWCVATSCAWDRFFNNSEAMTTLIVNLKVALYYLTRNM